ncbi:integrator complex subunit 14 [Neocloeon triangulifer]|uniref:integrator complex subunit 14 n=1 Tax=Neocloeon triangulifer TaxID=2078957 RepID=UPI00286F7076|nr:integrator complex subunit 14 [Neocloeon triangulifer]
MPTVVVIDVSLSMSRPVNLPDSSSESITRRQLAVQGISSLLNHLHVNSRLEFVAVIAFSSLYDVVCPFTRDFDLVRSKLNNLEEYDKTCLKTALQGVSTLVLEEWGNSTQCQILIVTDGSVGMGPNSLSACLLQDQSSPLPFPFPSTLNVVCLANPDEPGITQSIAMYQRLIELSGAQGSVHAPDQNLSVKCVTSLFQRLAESQYTSFHGTLSCGKLSSSIVLSPTPQPFCTTGEVESRKRISQNIEICGFLDVGDIGSPMVFSRHLVLPFGKDLSNVGVNIDLNDSDDENSSQDEGRMASFCVLLHGALKVENMVALCILGESWYGIIYSWADTKKKSNIMLSIFNPGLDVIPWLGRLDCLGVLKGSEQSEGLPVKPVEKRSYAQNHVSWIRHAGLQSDIQKILRHAKKLPDKTQQFYKELNRVRKAALIFGFIDLLVRLAEILDRECHSLPGSAHPDCALQLSHSASILRSRQCLDVNFLIQPLRTKFGQGD